MARLRIWNGRVYGILPATIWKVEGHVGHVYACARNFPDLQRLCVELGLPIITRSELREYWSADCWGRAMDGIEPERGLWVNYGPRSVTTRITPNWLARVTARGGEG